METTNDKPEIIKKIEINRIEKFSLLTTILSRCELVKRLLFGYILRDLKKRHGQNGAALQRSYKGGKIKWPVLFKGFYKN